jgi:hypothetical protein
LISDIQILKEHIEYVFELYERTIKGVKEEELDWRPVKEANNIREILTHLSRICNVSIPSRVKGNPNYIPKNWSDNYEKQYHSLNKLITDIQNGRKAVLNGLDKLSQSDMETEIPLWGGMRKRKVGLFSHLSEIAHHKGQIAYIRGIRRRQETK